MSNKAFILALYFVALFISVKNYYTQGGSGMPYPTSITAPTYLYAVLGLTSDFTGGLSTVLAAGLTLGLYYRTHNGNSPLPVKTAPGSTSSKTGVNVKVHNTPKGTNVKAPVKPGTNS